MTLAEQIAVQVRAAIASGDLAPGERLPPARELSVSLQVNMHTVLRAYQQLRDEELIAMRQGRGAFVRDDAGAASLRVGELAAQLAAEARKLGLSVQDLHARIDRLMGGAA
ncbi:MULTISPECIES: GntR family transcriptional regulator [unclassified Microbacterium]|uniref:GntR family transcriptional regulator n=1 Tax=unclassified Microbacterium TaxID=2609290 RepID=UPI00214C62BA|nr:MULTISPECIES: GntR family transcriptional regulator [unclassified Microbacterium]MCR2809954.1 GntR family transcriptional regulator [Microbacterium sp. zg.B185]WIM17741.1 GntR family transcriptional regulator [Microbacterium sp. zg-B185]